MRFLDCFHDDPLPDADPPRYDHVGPAAWLDANGNVHHGRYHPGIRLPLLALSDEQLEARAAEIVAGWGSPRVVGDDTFWHSRHPHHGPFHNLLWYNISPREKAS